MSSKKMSERAVVLSFGFVVGALVSVMPACTEPNPHHCVNNGGDQYCADKHTDWENAYCSDNTCVAEITNDGCQQELGRTSHRRTPRPSVLNLGCSTDAPPAHPRSTSMRASTPGLRARRSRPRDQGLDETPPSTNGGEELSALSNSVRGPHFRPVLVCKDLLTALVDEFERLHAVCPPRSVRVPGRRRRYGIIPACPVERSSGSASVFLLP